MPRRWTPSRCAPAVALLLAPASAHATGEALLGVAYLSIGSFVLGGVSASIAYAAAKTGSRLLLSISVLFGAVPVLLAVVSAASFVGTAGARAVVLALPMVLVATLVVWSWVVALRRVKQHLAETARADAWFAEKMRQSQATSRHDAAGEPR